MAIELQQRNARPQPGSQAAMESVAAVNEFNVSNTAAGAEGRCQSTRSFRAGSHPRAIVQSRARVVKEV